MQYQNTKKLTALVAIFATVFVLLFSAFYIEEHIDHDCTGNDCPICAVMEQCLNNLKTVGTAIVMACAVMVLSNLLQENTCHKFTGTFCNSLVSLKVRMDN